MILRERFGAIGVIYFPTNWGAKEPKSQGRLGLTKKWS